MRLLAVRDDPLAHFLPTKTTPNGVFFCAAPPGLAPELAELFMRPVNSGLSHKRRGQSPDKSPNKRPRLDGSVHEDEVEQGRRAGSLAPSIGMQSDLMGRGSLGPDGIIDFGDQTAGLDDYQLEIPEFDLGMGGEVDMDRERSKSVAPSALSRLSTPGPDGLILEEGDETYADATCPIAMFDVRPATQTQSQAPEKETETQADNEGKGYSKNTVKALGIIRKDLQPVVGQEDQEKVLSFRKMSDKVSSSLYISQRHSYLTFQSQASRRAAASFFFELLVLGTRDCVKLTQPAPFENIEIRAKNKLWEQQRHGSVAPSRFASVAPSRMSSVAPSRLSSLAPSARESPGPRGASVARSIGSAMGL
jgi:cohesin complex subunit SCC1